MFVPLTSFEFSSRNVQVSMPNSFVFWIHESVIYIYIIIIRIYTLLKYFKYKHLLGKQGTTDTNLTKSSQITIHKSQLFFHFVQSQIKSQIK